MKPVFKEARLGSKPRLWPDLVGLGFKPGLQLDEFESSKKVKERERENMVSDGLATTKRESHEKLGRAQE